MIRPQDINVHENVRYAVTVKNSNETHSWLAGSSESIFREITCHRQKYIWKCGAVVQLERMAQRIW